MYIYCSTYVLSLFYCRKAYPKNGYFVARLIFQNIIFPPSLIFYLDPFQKLGEKFEEYCALRKLSQWVDFMDYFKIGLIFVFIKI